LNTNKPCYLAVVSPFALRVHSFIGNKTRHCRPGKLFAPSFIGDSAFGEKKNNTVISHFLNFLQGISFHLIFLPKFWVEWFVWNVDNFRIFPKPSPSYISYLFSRFCCLFLKSPFSAVNYNQTWHIHEIVRTKILYWVLASEMQKNKWETLPI